jgi:N-methylhydantoinase A/oxoprolinase/acetone carboxylase beta subunit
MVDRDVSDQIGVDIGGTFTDCVLIGTDGPRHRGLRVRQGALDEG